MKSPDERIKKILKKKGLPESSPPRSNMGDNFQELLEKIDGEVVLSKSEEILSISMSMIQNYGYWDSLLILTNLKLLIRPRKEIVTDHFVKLNNQIPATQYTQDIELKHISNISFKGFERISIYEGEHLMYKVHIGHDTGEINLKLFYPEILFYIAQSSNLTIVERPAILRLLTNIIAFFKVHMKFVSTITQNILIFVVLGCLYIFYTGIEYLLNHGMENFDLFSFLIILIIFIVSLLSSLEYIFGIGPFVCQEKWKRTPQ